MNLSITPVRFSNNSSYNNKNNQNQNFGAFTDLIKIRKHPKEGGDMIRTVLRARDSVIDRFVLKMEDCAKEKGLNTAKFEKEKFSFEFIPENPFGRNMVAILNDSQDQIARTAEGHPFSTILSRGNELEKAEEFVNMMQDAKLIDKQA